ncbi:MAG TPA: pseudouridine-5'-phosphate glycosidase [Actinomycetes bacterium]|nr:pseudouridine-5'-phosphate glycosidase [Actinomycetes bacterium]
MELAMTAEVADALATGGQVVALESTIISHGLPRPDNLRIAGEIEMAVRDAGAVPATIAVLDGAVRVGLDRAGLATIAGHPDVAKASVRDLAIVLARATPAATTVASTAYLAGLAGIRVLATGGLGGVHRGATQTFDESADLRTLADTPLTVVCAGVKSILDVPATLERLETLSVGLVGYRTDRFPGFYRTDSGQPVPWRADSPEEIAEIMAMRDRLGQRQALVVANPLAESDQLDPRLHDRVLADGLTAAAAGGVYGKDVTPFLLGYFHERTGGASLAANVRLVLSNAALAARIAVAHAKLR